MRELCLATKAELDAHSFYTSQVLSAAETRKRFAEMADYAWTKTLCDMMSCLGDMRALARCGHQCDPSFAEKVSLEDAIVSLEDSRAQRFLHMVLGILRHRTSSLAWHTSGYPGILAGLLLEDAARRSAVLAKIKSHCDAVEWCIAGCALDQDMAARSLLKSVKVVDVGLFGTSRLLGSRRCPSMSISSWPPFSQASCRR